MWKKKQTKKNIFFAETFAMGKLHKDIALFMVKLVEEGEITPQQAIKVYHSLLFSFIMFNFPA